MANKRTVVSASTRGQTAIFTVTDPLTLPPVPSDLAKDQYLSSLLSGQGQGVMIVPGMIPVPPNTDGGRAAGMFRNN